MSTSTVEAGVSLVAASARLGISRHTLRYQLTQAGHPPHMGRDGRCFLTVSLEDAERIVHDRIQANLKVDDDLPGLSARKVAELLGVKRAAVYHQNRPGRLPADYVVEGPGKRRLRWSIPTVRRYAEQWGRKVAADSPLRHTGVDE
ncbi:MAG: hypothetical protein ACREN7_00055 [Candidatus Dormibacteria bacterium]